jgi:hypothetical protein
MPAGAAVHIVTGIPFSVTFNDSTNTFTITGHDYTSVFTAGSIITALGGTPNGGYQQVTSSVFSGGNTVVTVSSYSVGTTYPGPATFSAGSGTVIWFIAGTPPASLWTQVASDAIFTAAGDTPNSVAFLSATHAAVVTNFGNAGYTTDSGSTWTYVPSPVASAGYLSNIVSDGSSTYMAYAYFTDDPQPGPPSLASFTGTLSSGTLTVSGVTGTIAIGQQVYENNTTFVGTIQSGSGSTWVLNNTTTTLDFTSQPCTTGILYSGIVRSTDGGATWTDVTPPAFQPATLPSNISSWGVYNPMYSPTYNAWYVSASAGSFVPGENYTAVAKSTDGGNTWTMSSPVIPSSVSSGMANTAFTVGGNANNNGILLDSAGTLLYGGNGDGFSMFVGTITGGSGYVNGTYTNVPLTGGTGTGAAATIVVAGGTVTEVYSTSIGNIGYNIADTLSASNTYLGRTGTGFSFTITANNADFVALVGIVRSTDGTNWECTLVDLTSGIGNFTTPVQLGGTINTLGQGSGYVDGYTSTDVGATWTLQQSDQPTTPLPPYNDSEVLFDSSFVTGIDSGDNQSIGYSTDGITWTKVPISVATYTGTGLSTDSARIYNWGNGILSSTNRTSWTTELGVFTNLGYIYDILASGSTTLAIGGQDSDGTFAIWKRT